MGTSLRILHLEDDPVYADLVAQRLSHEGLHAHFIRVDSQSDFQDAIQESIPDLILADYDLPDFDGFDALKLAMENCPRIPFIFLSGVLGEERAVDGMKMGARDYIPKTGMRRLIPSIKRALKEAREQNKLQKMEEEREKLFLQVNLNRNLLNSVLKQIPSGVLVLDKDAKEIILSNPEFTHLFQFFQLEGLGDQGEGELGFREDGTAYSWIEWPIFRSLNAGEIIRNERISVRLQDGIHRSLSVSSSPIYSEKGTLQAAVAIFTDVTEFERTQDQLISLNEGLEARVRQRTSELETAYQDMESFSFSVSHDLRAPLRRIQSFLGLLQKRLGEDLDDTSREYLDIVEGSAVKMTNLINDLLVFNRLDRQNVSKKLIDTQELVDELIQALTLNQDYQKIEWNIGKLPKIHGDKNLLRIVFSNLLDNAAKFSSKRADPKIEIQGSVSEGNVVIMTIKDNGVGFDMQYSTGLFQVFKRLHAESEFEGTGIGLATVQRILEKHGGKIWTQSILDKGAEFFFSIPAKND